MSSNRSIIVLMDDWDETRDRLLLDRVRDIWSKSGNLKIKDAFAMAMEETDDYLEQERLTIMKDLVQEYGLGLLS